MTLVSTGTRSMFLSPTDALHGDIGILSNADALVLICGSHESEVLEKLVPYAKERGAKVYLITTEQHSRLSSECDSHVYLPVQRELCPFKMTPIASTVIQMLVVDTCAVAIMQAKCLSQSDYGKNHPAGRIGKRLVLKVGDIMRPWKNLPLVEPHDNALHALTRLATMSKGCGCLLVVDTNRKLLGTLADADLRRALVDKGDMVFDLKVSDLMNYSKGYPRVTRVSSKAFDAQLLMEKDRPVGYLPVLDDEGSILVGLVTLHHLAEAGL